MTAANQKVVVFCPASKKTQVLWSSSFFETCRATFDVCGVMIAWERESDLPPWHTAGTHNTNCDFDVIAAGNYCKFWFTSPVDLTVHWESFARGEADFMPRSPLELVRWSKGG